MMPEAQSADAAFSVHRKQLMEEARWMQVKDNRSSVLYNVGLHNVGCSHGVKYTKVPYLPSPVSGDGYCAL